VENKVKTFMNDWDDVTVAESLPEFCTRWWKFQQSYRQDTAILAYLCSTWLQFKEKLLSV
jgi:hypothetical protein